MKTMKTQKGPTKQAELVLQSTVGYRGMKTDMWLVKLWSSYFWYLPPAPIHVVICLWVMAGDP